MEFTKEALSTTKSQPSLIPPEFILGMGQVLAFGASKYSIDNWKKCPEDKLYLYKDALLRHFLAYISGEDNDTETGLSHLYHLGCNAAFLDYFKRNKNEQ